MARVTDKFKDSCERYLAIEKKMATLSEAKKDIESYLKEYVLNNGDGHKTSSKVMDIGTDRWMVTQQSRTTYSDEAGIAVIRKILEENEGSVLRKLIKRVEVIDQTQYKALKVVDQVPAALTKAYEAKNTEYTSFAHKVTDGSEDRHG